MLKKAEHKSTMMKYTVSEHIEANVVLLFGNKSNIDFTILFMVHNSWINW